MEKEKHQTMIADPLLTQFCQILNNNLQNPDEAPTLINAMIEYSHFVDEVSAWDHSLVSSISSIRELITQRGDKEQKAHFRIIADSFIKGMLIGSEYRRSSSFLFDCEDEIHKLLDENAN